MPIDTTQLSRGTRFRAFPTRSVRQNDGTYVVPVYRVTLVKRYEGSTAIHYRVDDEGTTGQWIADLGRLERNGLEILSATVKIERAKLYPTPGRGARQDWKWTYSYTVDDGPLCQYGPGLGELTSMLRRRHPGCIIQKTWEA